MNKYYPMTSRGNPLAPPTKVAFHTLVQGVDFRTPGGGTTFTNVEVNVPDWVREALVRCESVRAHVRVRGKSANFGVITRFYWSIDEAEWSSAVDLHTEITTEGQSITSYYTTAANFGLLTRWALGIRATTGTASEGANLTIVIEFIYRT
jgi:hypothetical protein